MTDPSQSMTDPIATRDRVVAAVSLFINEELLGTSSSERVTATADLLAGGYVDSLGVMRLVSFIEDKFEISIGPEDVTIENFLTISAIAEFVEGRST